MTPRVSTTDGDVPLTPETLQRMAVQDLFLLRANLKAKMSGVQSQLTAWNDDSLSGAYDEDWAASARSALGWTITAAALVKAEIARRADKHGQLPSSDSEAFVVAARRILALEQRRQIWDEAAARFPYLFLERGADGDKSQEDRTDGR
jgi:hypothetical protein